MINIYYACISEENHCRLIDNYLSDFSIEYQNRIRRYRRWQDAQLSLLGRVLLIRGMKNMDFDFIESDLKYTDFNKPYFDNINIQFNISHSGNLVVCAITKFGEIGIDIEKINAIKIVNFKSQMTDDEWNTINESHDAKRSFYKYWSQKEAVIKAHGNGLNIPLKSFEIKGNKTTIDSEKFYLKELAINDGYSCHLALKERLDSIEIKTNKINF